MKVKNTFPILIVFTILLVSCSKPEGFVIKGKITNAEEKYLYMDELKVASSVPVDSVKIGEDGTFEFTGKISHPNFYLLRLNKMLNNKNFVTLLVDTAETISVYGDAANFSRDYEVEGSPGSLLVQELNNHLAQTKHKMDSIRSMMIVFRTRENNSMEKIKWEQELSEIKRQQIDYSTNFVQNHPFSMSSVLALYQKFDDANYVIQDLQSLKVAASALNTVFPNSEHVKALYANTKNLMAQEKKQKLNDVISKNAVNSPDVSLPNPNGREISLSSLSGKIVLIQFWSALDRTSRIQNGALTELYSKYKSKGLEIYQISIDTDRSAWLTAIDQDQLSWINVGDMNGSQIARNLYNVQQIPANYILARDGQIVGKNLQGSDLDRAIARLIKQ